MIDIIALVIALVAAASVIAIFIRLVQINPARLQQSLDASLVKLEQGLRDEFSRSRQETQGTLEQRLGASFKMVNDSLTKVHESVGEMQALATGVGDLKRLLTNIKTRGTWGEVALGNVLGEILSPEQYAYNVEVRPGSNQRVEYAVKLPGDGEMPVWLPIDAKYPTEDYERLVEATEQGNSAAVDLAARGIEVRIRGAAKDISTKYIAPPHSTDFAIMFLPTEGLFAEVIKRPGLVDALQREFRVMVAGPTTLVSLLTSLRMGFRTLAIQQRSSEIWRVLSAVKSEFGKFADTLDKVQKKLEEAHKVVEDAHIRRRAVDRKLVAIEAMPESEVTTHLDLPPADASYGQ
jgi:DNA recombination protein RmuC